MISPWLTQMHLLAARSTLRTGALAACPLARLFSGNPLIVRPPKVSSAGAHERAHQVPSSSLRSGGGKGEEEDEGTGSGRSKPDGHPTVDRFEALEVLPETRTGMALKVVAIVGTLAWTYYGVFEYAWATTRDRHVFSDLRDWKARYIKNLQLNQK